MDQLEKVQSLFPPMSDKEAKSIKGGAYGDDWWNYGGDRGTNGSMDLPGVTIPPSGNNGGTVGIPGSFSGGSGGTGTTGGGGGTTGGDHTAAPGDLWGDHHLTNTANLPITHDNRFMQVGNLCVFQSMVNVSHYFKPNKEISLNDAIKSADLLTHNNNMTAITGFHGTFDQLNTEFSQYFKTEALTTNITTAINLDCPVLATIGDLSNAGGHEVMITGYNNNGTYTYYDPQFGEYYTNTRDWFTNPQAVLEVK